MDPSTADFLLDAASMSFRRAAHFVTALTVGCAAQIDDRRLEPPGQLEARGDSVASRPSAIRFRRVAAVRFRDPVWIEDGPLTIGDDGVARVAVDLAHEHLVTFSTAPDADEANAPCGGRPAPSMPGTAMDVVDSRSREIVRHSDQNECSCGTSRRPQFACIHRMILRPGEYEVVVRGTPGATVRWSAQGEASRCFWNEQISGGTIANYMQDMTWRPDDVITPDHVPDFRTSQTFKSRSQIIGGLLAANIDGLVSNELAALAAEVRNADPRNTDVYELDSRVLGEPFIGLLQALDGGRMAVSLANERDVVGLGTKVWRAEFSFRGHAFVLLLDGRAAGVTEAAYRDQTLTACYLDRDANIRWSEPSGDSDVVPTPLPLETFARPFATRAR